MPVPAPPRGLPAASTMESSSTRFRPIVPSPEPLLTATVYVAPLPVALVIDAPVTPVELRMKLDESTPVTLSLKVTVKLTLPALVGLVLTRLMEETEGAVVSTNTAIVLGGVKVRPASRANPSLIVPPFRTIGEAEAIPSVSVSPACTVYRNTSAVVPVPDT